MMRIKLLLAGAFLVAMTMTSAPARAMCVTGWISTPTDLECSDYCTDVRQCTRYDYDYVTSKCTCF